MEFIEFILILGIILVLGILGVVIGQQIIQYLTCDLPKMREHKLILSFSAVGLILTTIWAIDVTKWIGIIIILIFFTIIGGYVIQTKQVFSRKEPESNLAIRPDFQEKKDSTPKFTAIIYLTHGEPEHYNPQCWINQFREFDAQKIPFVPWLIRPLFLYNLRQHYVHVGTSHHRHIHYETMKLFEAQLNMNHPEKGPFRCYMGFLDDTPHPNDAVVQAINDGAAQIMGLTVFLTRSNHTAEGEHMVAELHPEKYGYTIPFSSPLWDSKILQRLFVTRVEQHRGTTPKEEVGVLLIGHGQPDEWDKEFPTETSQENSFRQEIITHFVQEGYKQENIQCAWMEFKSPKPAEIARQILKKKITKLFFFASAISADSLHSQWDIPNLLNPIKKQFGQKVEIINLGAWNSDLQVLEAYEEKLKKITKISNS